MPAIEPVAGVPSTVGLYSHAVPVPPDTRLVLVSGQLSVDADGEVVGAGDFETQMRQVFDNLLGVVRAAGGAPEGIVQFRTYLVDPDNVRDFYDVRASLFETLFPTGVYPGNTLLVVQRLVRPEFLIEVEAVVAVPA